MQRIMLVTAITTSLAAAMPLTIATSASANEVAGRPALPTTSVQELIKMRDSWGKQPSGKK